MHRVLFLQAVDPLDCSVRSDGGGWRSLRGGRSLTLADDAASVTSTGAGVTSSAAGVTLPPIGSSGKLTPVHRMTRAETQRLLAQAKVNLQALETA